MTESGFCFVINDCIGQPWQASPCRAIDRQSVWTSVVKFNCECMHAAVVRLDRHLPSFSSSYICSDFDRPLGSSL